MTPPKLFISYSWSSQEHEQWVIDLATQLMESGIDVILDKWDLKEGHDSVAFMEKMVTDPSISKVAVISDKTYAKKADARASGVGTETQIISREVYEKQDQQKFVAVLPVKDESGKPFLPTYYKGRIYIDLSEPERYAENFEKLLRWVYDKPLYVKPELGGKPAFLAEGERVSLGTTAAFNRCIDAIKNNKPFMAGAIDEYFSTFAENLERFRLAKSADKEFDDAVVEGIDEFLPYRNEAIQLLITIAQYSPTIELAQKTHRFFERLIPFMDRPEGISQWSDWDFDNFRFIVHELFLYAIAIFIKFERFEFANELMTQSYYLPNNSNNGRDATSSYVVIHEDMKSLTHRNARLALARLSVRADMLEKRSKASGIDFKYLVQADFVLFMRADYENDIYSRWWPETLVYASRAYGPCEVFARSVSKSYFDRVKCLLAIGTPEELKEKIDSYHLQGNLPRWQHQSFSPSVLLGYDKLCSKV